MRFTLASLARIEEAEKTDSVDFLDDLLCECGARVKARRSPMEVGGRQTLHYPQKGPPLPPGNVTRESEYRDRRCALSALYPVSALHLRSVIGLRLLFMV